MAGPPNTAQAQILGSVPKKKLAKADHEKQKEWIDNELPQIHKDVETVDGALLYEDEVVFQQSGTISRTWAPVGVGTEVKSQPGRDSVKVMGAVDVTSAEAPKLHYLFTITFNAITFLIFLQRLITFYPGKKVFLILDNARYHHAKLLRPWLEENKDRISLHFLPPYSPEFNAIEYVWRATKRKSTHNRYFPTRGRLNELLYGQFESFQQFPGSLYSTVQHYALPLTKSV